MFFFCSLRCQTNMNLVFHISEDGSEIDVNNIQNWTPFFKQSRSSGTKETKSCPAL